MNYDTVFCVAIDLLFFNNINDKKIAIIGLISGWEFWSLNGIATVAHRHSNIIEESTKILYLNNIEHHLQIDRHTVPNAESYLTYYGASKTLSSYSFLSAKK